MEGCLSMTFEFDYSRDAEFSRLLARRPVHDLATAALELSRDAQPDLDIQKTLDWIDRRAAELRPLVAQAYSERELVSKIAGTVAGEWGIVGSPDAYQEAEGSFLDQVIEKRRGIPISISVLYVALCQRIGLDLSLVAAPLHVLTRFEAPEGTLFLDAFAGQRILTYDEALTWLRDISGLPKSVIKRSLGPADARTTITRMLTNLKVLYSRQEDWQSVWRVQNRLVALNPTDYRERRDLGITAINAERPGVAIRLLESLLNSCPDDDRAALSEQIDRAKQRLSNWN
ncbi:tetratricopeptide repeat protein [bacterium]|nr:tetratricopeptide repeat protein [bacterium]